ncbi:hypothetical protein Ciccas_005023 [Cichlidogyrus casuarinus]|uniref:YTH domain-containing protein n=1 Tax=Cichlidogyrus casuarinus TaxID=1844966 RepID=A0ABD2QA31_9PLAT
MHEEQFARARFFVIKSRWAENVLQAITHEVWCSTVNGNAVLDAAFRQTHRERNLRPVEEDVNVKGEVEISFEEVRKSSSKKSEHADGHVYLFFSVNGSRQFCGIAEMIGPVEKNRSACVWQDSFKFKDSFPIRWLYIKDVENTLCNHLLLPEHDNRPITFLRDAAEIVSRAKAIELFRIFHNHP